MYTRDNMTYFKLGIKRKAKIYKPDFSEEFIENYPNVIIAFNNHPDTQLVAIQNNKAAFGNCLTASHIIQKSIDRWAKNSNLNFFIEPQFDSREFWNLVRQHAGQITQVTFDLVTPNLAKISKNLKVDLKELYNDTNTQRTKVELNAEPESHLDIKEDSEIIRSIVDYGAEGGGNISMRVAGLRKKLHTAQSPKDFNVDEHLVNGNDWEALDDLFKTIMM